MVMMFSSHSSSLITPIITIVIIYYSFFFHFLSNSTFSQCKRETKNWKVLLRKARVTKTVISDTKSCPIQLESGSLKVSCQQIKYRTKTIGDDWCMIVWPCQMQWWDDPCVDCLLGWKEHGKQSEEDLYWRTSCQHHWVTVERTLCIIRHGQFE